MLACLGTEGACSDRGQLALEREFQMLHRLLCALLLVSGFGAQAHAFGTINHLSQSSEHGKITRIALRPFGLGPRTMAEVAGKRGRFGAVGAPDHPKRRIYNKSIAHCSAGDYLAVSGYPQSRPAAVSKLRACRKWIVDHLQQAVVAAARLIDSAGRIRSSQVSIFVPCVYLGNKGRAKCNVIGALGVAFHAAQDFYSHSNWTDKPRPGRIDTKNPPGLGNKSRAAWLDPRRNIAFPRGLISGCFQGIPESRYCVGRVRHIDLAKDTGSINVAQETVGPGATRRGLVNGNFARAVRAAIADTRDKWRYFEAQVLTKYGRRNGGKIICAMRQDSSKGC